MARRKTPAPVEAETTETPAPVVIVSLGDFIEQHEQAANELGVVVARITHPDASPGIHAGRYSGIRLLEGEPSAVYSDGSKH